MSDNSTLRSITDKRSMPTKGSLRYALRRLRRAGAAPAVHVMHHLRRLLRLAHNG
jgi:hypothetical protein